MRVPATAIAVTLTAIEAVAVAAVDAPPATVAPVTAEPAATELVTAAAPVAVAAARTDSLNATGTARFADLYVRNAKTAGIREIIAAAVNIRFILAVTTSGFMAVRFFLQALAAKTYAADTVPIKTAAPDKTYAAETVLLGSTKRTSK